ncbi:MAG: PhzF family phenazine biosynthesis protein [Spirochaetia bacterium]|nr:PhzF family phenazine biosynthesis protein [Spirochaetia bacterium]
MKISMYQVDAFASSVFRGNPAAVCPLDAWIPDSIMQSIAMENNLAETAFFVSRGNEFEIRWFTPAVEIALCGHATLASAFVANRIGKMADRICFQSKSGPLYVEKQNDLYSLNFPARVIGPSMEITEAVSDCLGKRPLKLFSSEPNLLAIFDSEDEIRNLAPDFRAMKALASHGIIVSAPGKQYDFVSRFFAPGVGVDEDPVTGSAHCTLIPYWASELKKKNLKAFQASSRGGELICEFLEDRVTFAGTGSLYLEGIISIPD